MDDWYFAYGSNLWIEQMVRRTGPFDPAAPAPQIARLPGYRLAFDMRGEDGQRYADIVTPGEGVIGVVYRVSAQALAILDEYETGYERQRLTVTTMHGQPIDAVTYIVLPAHRTTEGSPSAEYLTRILTGAREQGLPADYIESIIARAQGAMA